MNLQIFKSRYMLSNDDSNFTVCFLSDKKLATVIHTLKRAEWLQINCYVMLNIFKSVLRELLSITETVRERLFFSFFLREKYLVAAKFYKITFNRNSEFKECLCHDCVSCLLALENISLFTCYTRKKLPFQIYLQRKHYN